MAYFRLYLTIIIVIYPIFAQSLDNGTSEHYNSDYNKHSDNFDQDVDNNNDDKYSSTPQQHNEFKEDYCYTYFSIALLGPSAFGPPLEIPDRNYDVIGMRFNILFGEHENLYGFDLGIYNYLSESLYGVQFGVLNIIHQLHSLHSFGLQMGLGNFSWNDHKGIQIGGYNYVEGFVDWQLGIFNRFSKNTPYSMDKTTVTKRLGMQIGVTNFAFNREKVKMFGQIGALVSLNNAEIQGIQTSLFNSSGNMYGLQIGLFNKALRVKGVQIGVVNICDQQMSGIQIGLINFIYHSDIPVLPLINAQF